MMTSTIVASSCIFNEFINTDGTSGFFDSINYQSLLKALHQDGIDLGIRQHNRIGLHTTAATIGDD